MPGVNTIIYQVSVLVLALGLLSSIAMAKITGEDLYYQNCSQCHDEDAAGVMPGIPDLGGLDGPLWKPLDQLFRTVVNGVDRADLPTAMPPRGGNEDLTDIQLRLILNFMRRAFGEALLGETLLKETTP